LSCGKGKAFCERPYAPHRQQPEKDQQNIEVAPREKISAVAHVPITEKEATQQLYSMHAIG